MQTIAVIPIFMSASAAAMPTIMAALASVGAIIFKPRALLALFRRRPIAAGTALASVGLAVALTTWWLRTPAHLAPHAAQAAHYDWASVARDILAQQRIRQMSTSAPVQSTTASITPVPPQTVDFDADPARTLYHGGPSPAKLTPLWTYLPEDADTMFLSMPAIAGKHLYAAGCQADLGGYTGILACLDADTGKPLWQVTRLGDDPLLPFFSSPAVTPDGQYLIIGQGLHTDRNCSLLCFAADSGKLRWAAQTPLHIESSPAIFGDLAVVGAGAIEGDDGRAIGNPGFVLAVRISDGQILWRQAVNDPESSPAIDPDGNVYIGSGFNGCAVYALRSSSDDELRAKHLDRVLWRTPVSYPVTGPVTLAGDIVLVGGGNSDLVHANRNARGQVIALDRHSGKILWQSGFADAVLGGIACRGDTLICPVRTGEVVALSLKDGQFLWHTPISGRLPILAGCAFTTTRIYAVSSDGILAALDPSDGRVLEKILLNTKPGTGLTMAAPQVIAGRIIVGSETGGLRCLVGLETAP